MTIRITPDEIGKRYDLIMNDYEHVRSQTIGLNYVEKFLSVLSSNTKSRDAYNLLEIGCGTGIPITNHLVSSGAEVTGLDISTEMVKRSRRNIPHATFILRQVGNMGK